MVAIGDAHAGQEVHDLLLTMLSDPRLYGAASDIIVEFGNAFYQDTLDKFILAGEPVSDASLRLVWRDTTQSPNIVLDCPVYEQVYRRVRAVNWTLPADRKIRVLAGAFARMAAERRLEELYNKWFLRRLPTGETLNLPMSPQLAEIFRVLGAPD